MWIRGDNFFSNSVSLGLLQRSRPVLWGEGTHIRLTDDDGDDDDGTRVWKEAVISETDSFRCLGLIPTIASNLLVLDLHFPKSLLVALESLWVIQGNLQSQLEVSRGEAVPRGLNPWGDAGTAEVVQAM